MGHTRLAALPRTRKWQQVVALIGAGAATSQIANATIDAAENGLQTAAGDPAIVETLWLLTQLPLDARSDDFVGALRHTGLAVSDQPSLIEITAAVSECIDARVQRKPGRTDLGEMAQMAAIEAITKVVTDRTHKLFDADHRDVRDAFKSMATVKQFGLLSREFFGRLTDKCLNYFLSRAIHHHVGEGERFETLSQQATFKRALGTHSYEAALIVEKFSGEWFSKTQWERRGISKQEVRSFSHIAMRKICSELKEGAGHDVD
jgi:hypothetical protein